MENENKQPKSLGIIFSSLAVAVIVATAFIGGCNIGDIVKSQVPMEAQKIEGLPARVSHNDSVAAYRQWANRMREVDVQWRERLDQSGQAVAFFTQLGSDLIMEGQTVVGNSGIPMAATLTGLMAFAGGWFLPTPGSRKREDSLYDEGLKVGQSLAKGESVE